MTADPFPLPKPQKFEPDPEPMLCYCFQITEKTVEDAIRIKGLTSIEEINAETQAGCGCHTCWPDLEELLERCKKGTFKYWPGIK